VRQQPHKEEEKAKTRAALLEATLELAASHGFASLGLREVAREAGIAPTSFYRHFADMRELGLALIEEHVKPVLARLAARAQGDGAVIDALLAELSLAAVTEPHVLRFMLAERYGAQRAFRHALRAAFGQLAASFVREGRRPAPRGAAEAVVAVLFDYCDGLLDGDSATQEAGREAAAKALGFVLGHTAAGGERG
jgi:TetR/AcrR family transcriptional regulator, fatty acid biosynthesis regulator